MRFVLTLLKSNLFWFVSLFVGIFVICNYTDFSKHTIPGFGVKKIEFDGNEKVQEALLYKVAGIKYRSNILNVSVQDVKNKLEQISWVRSVEVQRRLPDRFYIRISEREPIAILQSKYKLYLLDEHGKILEHDGIGEFGNLPIVVGEDAEKHAKHLLFVLNQFPKIRKQLVCAIFIGKRRWDIKINKGVLIKFPEKHLKHAMTILDEISDDKGFFKDDIEEIDLRMLDRVIVKTNNGKKK